MTTEDFRHLHHLLPIIAADAEMPSSDDESEYGGQRDENNNINNNNNGTNDSFNQHYAHNSRDINNNGVSANSVAARPPAATANESAVLDIAYPVQPASHDDFEEDILNIYHFSDSDDEDRGGCRRRGFEPPLPRLGSRDIHRSARLQVSEPTATAASASFAASTMKPHDHELPMNPSTFTSFDNLGDRHGQTSSPPSPYPSSKPSKLLPVNGDLSRRAPAVQVPVVRETVKSITLIPAGGENNLLGSSTASTVGRFPMATASADSASVESRINDSLVHIR